MEFQAAMCVTADAALRPAPAVLAALAYQLPTSAEAECAIPDVQLHRTLDDAPLEIDMEIRAQESVEDSALVRPLVSVLY